MFLVINFTEPIDALKINFDSNGLWALNISLAIIMFGVSLNIHIDDFKRLFKSPKIVLTGIFSQFILFPALTFALVYFLEPTPSIALGMFMVAACPGGNVSNFMTQMAGGNAALSVSLTAFATLVAVIMTPINFEFWSNLYPPTKRILETVALNPYELVKLVFLILGIPLVIGMLIRHFKPVLAKKMVVYLRPISILIFVCFIVIAFLQNWSIFTEHIHHVSYLVILHNILAYIAGFYFAKSLGFSKQIQKTLAIETGIQNSGLGLLLVFAFFDGLGGMALLVAFWGIWDILSGLLLASYWEKKQQHEKNLV